MYLTSITSLWTKSKDKKETFLDVDDCVKFHLIHELNPELQKQIRAELTKERLPISSGIFIN
jgi:hypothetical protein